LTNCKTFAEANLKYLNFGIAAQWCCLNWDTRIATESNESFGYSYGPLEPKLFEEMREGTGLNDLLTEEAALEARDFISRSTPDERKRFFDNFGPNAPKFTEFPYIGEPAPAEVLAELIKPKKVEEEDWILDARDMFRDDPQRLAEVLGYAQGKTPEERKN